MRVSFEQAAKMGLIDPCEVPSTSKKRRSDYESEEQASLIKTVRVRFPSVGHFLIHIPNGGSRKNAFEGWRLKEQGVRAGVSDLLLPVARGGYFGLWIEFKASPPNDSPISKDQKEWLDIVRQQGYYAEMCKGEASAVALIARYLDLPHTKPEGGVLSL